MASALFGKLEMDIEIKASADRMFEFASRKMSELSNTSPDKVASCELIEGDWGKEGSVISWNYVLGIVDYRSLNTNLVFGNGVVGKELIEAIDLKTNLITYRVIEGYLLQYYKSMKRSFKVTPRAKGDEEGSSVHLSLEFEKLHDKIPDPHTKLQFISDLVKDVDAHLSSQKYL